jgi:deoxyribonuclease-4
VPLLREITLGTHISLPKSLDGIVAHCATQGSNLIQTHWGSPQTLRGIKDPEPYKRVGGSAADKPYWVIHAAYVANMTPKDETRKATLAYIKQMLTVASTVKASLVIHVGGTKDQEPVAVRKRIGRFLNEIAQVIQDIPDFWPGAKLLIENVAAKYPFNQDLRYLTDAIEEFRDFTGWCLDTHHAHGAGVDYLELAKIIDNVETRPDLVHANFPGAPFASGRDRHGWFYQQAAAIEQPNITGEQLCLWQQNLLKIAEKGIPMVLEGGSTDGELALEYAAVKSYITES